MQTLLRHPQLQDGPRHNAMQHTYLLEHKYRKAPPPDLQCPAPATFGRAQAVKQGTAVQVFPLSLAEVAPKPSAALPGPRWKEGGSTCNLHHSGKAHEGQSLRSHQLMAPRSHSWPLWAGQKLSQGWEPAKVEPGYIRSAQLRTNRHRRDIPQSPQYDDKYDKGK